MALDLLAFVGGLVVLLAGAEALVRGAASLAAALGVPAVLIGMTIVAFGTSAPELVVSVTAAAGGQGGVAFGNVVGSNLANVGLLLGLVVVLRPLRVHDSIVIREIPMMILISAAAVVLALGGAWDGAPEGFGRTAGVVLLLFFSVFLYYSVQDALRQRAADPFLEQAATSASQARAPSWGASGLLVLVGLAGVGLGGKWLVDGAVDLARGFGVSEVVIGATLVAVGTSLPELATSLLAARRSQPDLAVGNIVGSNIFNLGFVLGTSAVVAPVGLPAGGATDLGFMTGLAVLLLPLSLSHGRELRRWEGLLLLGVYLGWVVLRVVP